MPWNFCCIAILQTCFIHTDNIGKNLNENLPSRDSNDVSLAALAEERSRRPSCGMGVCVCRVASSTATCSHEQCVLARVNKILANNPWVNRQLSSECGEIEDYIFEMIAEQPAENKCFFRCCLRPPPPPPPLLRRASYFSRSLIVLVRCQKCRENREAK